MPQMMPINWIMSFIFFLLVFIIFNALNYYIFILKSNKTLKTTSKNKFSNLNWKW